MFSQHVITFVLIIIGAILFSFLAAWALKPGGKKSSSKQRLDLERACAAAKAKIEVTEQVTAELRAMLAKGESTACESMVGHD